MDAGGRLCADFVPDSTPKRKGAPAARGRLLSFEGELLELLGELTL
jgi:hypothetical protein